MRYMIEEKGNFRDLMLFIGQYIDYGAPFFPNLPIWWQWFDGYDEAVKLVVGTARDDDNAILSCCVIHVSIISVREAQAIDGAFQAVSELGFFGQPDDGLREFTMNVAKQYIVP